MNILMVNEPFSGHVNPTLPLAKELVARGHNVSYILTNEWKERIEATGANFIPYNENADFFTFVAFAAVKKIGFLLSPWIWINTLLLKEFKNYI